MTGPSASRAGRRPRVVYWNNIPAPYMVERFNAVGRRGNIELEVWFGARTEPDRLWAVDERDWEFPYRYLPRFGVGVHKFSVPTPVLMRGRPDLLVSLYATPSFLTGLRVAWWRGWRTAIWVEVTFESWVRRRAWKEALKRAVFARVDGIITAGQDGRSYAMRYGATPERIHVARHVVDIAYFAEASALMRRSRREIRAELGLGGVVYLYVGRLWSGKGIAPLVDAYGRVSGEIDASLLVVGNGPEAAAIERAKSRQGLRITLAGFHQKSDLPRMYAASDVFVFPTLGDPYGLVVDEAMAAGLPIISTTAAGEIRERVIDGENGRLVSPGNSDMLAHAMRDLGADDGLRARMGARSSQLIATHTPQAWAEAFETAVERIIARSKPSEAT